MDAVTIGDLQTTYMVSLYQCGRHLACLICWIKINTIPTLLAFSRGEPQLETKVTKLSELKDKQFLIRWLEEESRRRGAGGAGGRSWFSGLFGS